MQRQNARSYKPCRDDDGCRRGLNKGCHQHPQEKSLKRIIRHLLHNRLKSSRRTHPQRSAHETHTIQKHCQSAK